MAENYYRNSYSNAAHLKTYTWRLYPFRTVYLPIFRFRNIDSTISFISIFTASLFSRGILVDEYYYSVFIYTHTHDMTTSTSSAECLRLIGPSASPSLSLDPR